MHIYASQRNQKEEEKRDKSGWYRKNWILCVLLVHGRIASEVELDAKNKCHFSFSLLSLFSFSLSTFSSFLFFCMFLTISLRGQLPHLVSSHSYSITEVLVHVAF